MYHNTYLTEEFYSFFNIQSKVNYLVRLINFLNTIFILFVENTLHQQAGGRTVLHCGLVFEIHG